VEEFAMDRNQRVLIILSGLLFSVATARGAENTEEDLSKIYDSDALTSIATGTQKPIHLAPAVASVITAQDIQNMGATSLDEALEMVPGMHVSVSPLKDLNSLYSIRGIGSGFDPQVLVTINGIPVRESYSGARLDTFRLPVANISRIEVIRGPGSAVHGSDAFAGVINVITKSAEEIGGPRVGVRTGSFNSKEIWGQIGGHVDDWQIALSMESAKSDGDPNRKVSSDLATQLGAPSYATAYPLQTRYDILNTRLGISNARWDISVSSWSQHNGGLGPGAAQAIDPIGSTRIESYQFDAGYHFPEKLNGWEMSSRLSHQYINEKDIFQLLPPGTVVPIGNDGNIGTTPNVNCPVVAGLGQACLVSFPNGIWGNPGGLYKNDSFELDAIYSDTVGHLIRTIIGVNQQTMAADEIKNFGPGTPAANLSSPAVISGALTSVTGTPYVYMLDEKRTDWYFALQDEWQFAPDWTLTSGVRDDRYSDFGNTINPRMALVWATNYNLTSKLLYGSAFRAPSFSELYVINNPVILGNPQLKPEKVNTLELAFDYRPTFTWQHLFNTYYYKAKDLIGYAATTAGLVAQNLNQQNGYGFELESKWKPSDAWQFSAAFSWQHSKIQDVNTTVPDAPGQLFTTSLLWKPQYDWSVYCSTNSVMNRVRAAGDTRSNIADYTFVNLTVRKRLSESVEFATSARNLFNAVGLEPSNGKIAGDYPLAGRSLFAELSYQFGK
jgi:iron complex outermembrane receptor protein